jgi:hypothetical protein
MSDKNTIHMISAFFQDATPTQFLSGFFKSPPQNFYNSEEVEIDIMRGGEEVAIVVENIGAGYRGNVADIYTNKRLKAPVYKESAVLNAFELTAREPGRNPFESVDFQVNAVTRVFRSARKLEQKIRRAVELQASQILQTGILTLIDQAGVTLYDLNFGPKSTHFVNAAIAWDQANYDPLVDIAAMANVIRADALKDPDTLIFGEFAWDKFIRHEVVLKLLDNRRLEIGLIAPQFRGKGAVFQGTIIIGSYKYNMWTYTGRYKHPQTGVSTRFMETDKVIVMCSDSRLDATFGGIPRIVAPDPRVMQFIPERMSDEGVSMDLSVNAWVTPNGESLEVGVGSRPLLIPTDIDSFGCIDTDF